MVDCAGESILRQTTGSDKDKDDANARAIRWKEYINKGHAMASSTPMAYCYLCSGVVMGLFG
ncbi:hypothetical protein SORBI_3002G218350 [Sorghum bicolor]|uniref:Uncharacterized protein n=1 Tax=Sorghum bicolor TaxID=4558 RepID=A0A1W0W596_SORBI|nr:hypothetical protein SORBI_3002G218350 [Sorghum bicolor]